ncbi:MAG: porin family protein [Ferruginibacter sp.]
MRKVFLSSALATILFAGTLSAQHSSQKITLGIKGGLNLYKISTDNSSDYDAKIGFNAGLLAHVHLVPHLALQPEIVYSQQGAKGTGSGAEFKSKLNYINVPVLLQYMFDNGFRIQAGPQLGFLATAKQKIGNNAATDVKGYYKDFDFALSGGVSYVHPSTGLGVDLRYVHGLSNINKNTTIKSTNRGGQLGIFYLIHHRH